MADQYILRRTILTAVRQCEPAAAELDDIEQFPPLEMNAAVTPNQILGTARELAERGYLADLRPGRVPLFRLTAKGRGQLDREEDLDEYVWGQFASKFAK